MKRVVSFLLLWQSSLHIAQAFYVATHVSHSRHGRSHPILRLHLSEEPNIFESKSTDEPLLSDEELLAQNPDWDDTVARFNTVHLSGRIGAEPKTRYFDDGKVVVNLNLAVQRKYHPLERKHFNIAYGQEETDWFGLEIWGRTAEFASKYVDKGMRVSVIGSLQVDQWTDKESGEPRSRTKVVVRELDIMETRAEGDLRRSKRSGSGSGGTSNFFSEDDFGASSAGSGGFFDD
ncbi:single-strand DNA-binding protein [Fistulifera solaris]|uniref:Single-strand DNA-binding protein n=1 Tax=Fistulifera solaris TaxID=1519565 RepID=A0A1Z5KE78_FISSO|nr:single-strand DNA-binding protein [Fistulifera solaris]|eukprot:GAX24391.1 single-strand DNA-binding protein [Fistulifera solaris]